MENRGKGARRGGDGKKRIQMRRKKTTEDIKRY
jgi:hypothetical protein